MQRTKLRLSKQVLEKSSNSLMYDHERNIWRFRTSLDPEFQSYAQIVLDNLKKNISNCGQWYSFDFFCKRCLNEGKDLTQSFLKTKKVRVFCGIRYCDHMDCIADRFANTLEMVENITRIKDLKSMFHFIIGFEKIDINDFEAKRKDFERIIHRFFNECRKAGLNVQCLKFLDISKGDCKKEWDGKYFIHFHFMAIPFRSSDHRKNCLLMHSIRQKILKNQKKKVLFHLKFFGNKKKKAMLNYLALRVSGLYKPYDAQIVKNFKKRELRVQLLLRKFLLFKDLFSIGQYSKLFYNKRFLSVLGNIKGLQKEQKILLQCSNSRNNLSNLLPKKCRFHGELHRSDIKVYIFVAEDPPEHDLKPIIEKVSENFLDTSKIFAGVLYEHAQKHGYNYTEFVCNPNYKKEKVKYV